PVEQDEASLLGVLPDRRRQLVLDVVQLVVGVEEERDVEDVERGVDRAQADRGKRSRLQRVEAHLAQHGRLVALRAAVEDGDGDAAARRRLPFLAHLLDVLVPDGPLGHEGGELDRDRRLRRARGGERDGKRGGERERYCLVRLAVHSICPMPATSACPLIASPSTSPVNTTSIAPCGVCAVIVSLNFLPSSVPATGTSPIWLPNVPEILPASSVK